MRCCQLDCPAARYWGPRPGIWALYFFFAGARAERALCSLKIHSWPERTITLRSIFDGGTAASNADIFVLKSDEDRRVFETGRPSHCMNASLSICLVTRPKSERNQIIEIK